MLKRLLNIADWNAIDASLGSLQTRMVAQEATNPTTLATRMGTAETTIGTLGTRMTAAESGLTGHETRLATIETKFGSGKATTLAAVTATPSGGVVDVIGIQVATGAAITNLISCYNTLKTSHNDLLARCKSWGWMAA